MIFFCIDKIFVKSQIDQFSREDNKVMNFLISLLNNLLVFMSSYRLTFIYQILWKKISPLNDIQVIYKNNQIRSVKINERDFIGSFQ